MQLRGWSRAEIEAWDIIYLRDLNFGSFDLPVHKTCQDNNLNYIYSFLMAFFFSFFFRTRREKEEWLAALFEAIKELYQRKSSLKIGREILRPCDSEIGKKQPHILKLEAIHKCMECAQPFSMMRKKYNCRACGVVSSFFITYLRPYRVIFKKRVDDSGILQKMWSEFSHNSSLISSNLRPFKKVDDLGII